jgi:hypothetical protein
VPLSVLAHCSFFFKSLILLANHIGYGIPPFDFAPAHFMLRIDA